MKVISIEDVETHVLGWKWLAAGYCKQANTISFSFSFVGITLSLSMTDMFRNE